MVSNFEKLASDVILCFLSSLVAMLPFQFYL